MDSRKFLTEGKALAILGPRRFFSRKQVADCWNELKRNSFKPKRKIRIPYSEEIITEFSKKKMWRLVFDPGFSLIQLRKLIGEGCDCRPCFCIQNRWWLERPFASKKRKPGYLLIKLRPSFCNLEWEKQEQRIEPPLFRASASLTLNTVLSIFLLTKNSSFNLLHHWGVESDTKKTRCAFGINKEGCIFLYNWVVNSPSPELGACLFKNPAC